VAMIKNGGSWFRTYFPKYDWIKTARVIS